MRKTKWIHIFFIYWSMILKNIREKYIWKHIEVLILQAHTKIQFHSIPKVYPVPAHLSHLTCLFYSTESHILNSPMSSIHHPSFSFHSLIQLRNKSDFYWHYILDKRKEKNKKRQIICLVSCLHSCKTFFSNLCCCQ